MMRTSFGGGGEGGLGDGDDLASQTLTGPQQ